MSGQHLENMSFYSGPDLLCGVRQPQTSSQTWTDRALNVEKSYIPQTRVENVYDLHVVMCCIEHCLLYWSQMASQLAAIAKISEKPACHEHASPMDSSNPTKAYPQGTLRGTTLLLLWLCKSTA